MVILKNGNRLRCKVIKLEYGYLYIDSDGFGKINVKWIDVAKVITKSPQRIRFRDKEILLVRLDTSSTGIPIIAFGDFYEPVDYNNISSMMNIDSRLIQRINGTFDLGMSYIYANKTTTLSAGLNAYYVNNKSRSTLNMNSVATGQSVGDSIIISKKQNVNFMVDRYFKNKYYWNGIVTIEENTQLALNFRSILGTGIGNTVISSNLQSLYITGGIALNIEDGIKDQQQNSYEGLLMTEYRLYKVSTPKFLITFTNSFFPSLTIDNRYRFNTDLKLDFELIKNFTVGFRTYHILDTKPLDSAGSNYDFGLTGTIGIIY